VDASSLESDWRVAARAWQRQGPQPDGAREAQAAPAEPTMHVLTVVDDCGDPGQLLHTHDDHCRLVEFDPPPYGGDDPRVVMRQLGIDCGGEYLLCRSVEGRWSLYQPPPPPRPESVICQVTELDELFCAHCWGHTSPVEEVAEQRARLRERKTAPRPSPTPGTCSGCRRPYGPLTIMRPDPLGGWRMQCCWND